MLAGSRLAPDVVIRPHHRGKGTLWPEALGVESRLRGKLTPVPQDDTETVVAGKEDVPICAPQPWPASNRPQLYSGGNFLLKGNLWIEKCSHQ